MTRDEIRTRLAVADAQAHAALAALGVERPDSDEETSLAIGEADAEIAAATGTENALVVRVLRRRAELLRAASAFRFAVARAHEGIGGER